MNTATMVPVGQRAELGLTGMTCAACAARIEKTLNRVPGVHANVNFATEIAAVGFDPAVTSVDQLIAAVARAGYGATLRQDVEEDRKRDQARKAAEYAATKRDFILAAVLTVPLLAQMVPMLASGDFLGMSHADLLPRWLQLVLATPVQFWSGRRFYIGAFHTLRGGGANMDVLVALGTTMAYAFSAVVTIFGLMHQRRCPTRSMLDLSESSIQPSTQRTGSVTPPKRFDDPAPFLHSAYVASSIPGGCSGPCVNFPSLSQISAACSASSTSLSSACRPSYGTPQM